MTNTIEALDKFTRALELMLPPPAPVRPNLPGDPDLAAAQAPRVQELTGSGDPAITPPLVRGAAVSCEGITRKGPRGDWHRPVRLALLALTIGLGFRFLIRMSASAGDSYGRQGIKKLVAGPQHRHPKAGVPRTGSHRHHHVSR